ncbi:MAG: DNA mismatch repair protein MutS [Flavobacteriales bacterium TMED288]|nr:DNA mismatch repair protein MutS [Flavobacteriales bacterium]RPG53534.1 MAG: DNA mismatch repair protein MutS [Flavobacteriales bacterium TMED288]
MDQYNKVKNEYPDSLILFRVGDFYETFGDDAIRASKILGIVLTNRSNGSSKVELAGFPFHSLDNYLPKLVKKGCRVAICEQLEDAKFTKKLVKRGVTELVTPGVSFNNNIIENKSNNFLSSIYFKKDKNFGISLLDISTGEFYLAEGDFNYIKKLIQSFSPSEILFSKAQTKKIEDLKVENYYTYKLDNWIFDFSYCYELLLNHFETKSLKGYGIDNLHSGIVASGAIIHYLKETRHNRLSHISSIQRIIEENYIWMDHFTIRNLELIQPNSEKGKSLLDILDNTSSPMGYRALKRAIIMPSNDIGFINSRLKLVDFFNKEDLISNDLKSFISKIGDIERLLSKLATLRINPREVFNLKVSLKSIKSIKLLLGTIKNKEIITFVRKINSCDEVINMIDNYLNETPPINLLKGNVISEGVSNELDEYRSISGKANEYLKKIRQREIDNTGIQSLKISFNNVFGYYIEVRNTHKNKVPESWIRKQTLVSAERYVTPELKDLETKILEANDKILNEEKRLFNELIYKISKFINLIQCNSKFISELDLVLSFSISSHQNGYTKPNLNSGFDIDIKDGRHPVIEKELKDEQSYIANDIFLDNKTQQILMITGPNMSGKSALLRQTALIIIMAQMGSYVPAKSAYIGIVDKIFTRVGASDNISSGESTFMVEMNESASIINNISSRSLILLDEIGRGTSTFDGISIAWAIAEYIHENKSKAKTLFATHYHELNEMTKSFQRIKNYNVSVKEINKEIIFLRKLKKGGSEHSFGIHVAKLAGMPLSIISSAKKILKSLEFDNEKIIHNDNSQINNDMQLSFFNLDDPVLAQIKDELSNIDINSLTPVEALIKLNQIKNMIGK